MHDFMSGCAFFCHKYLNSFLLPSSCACICSKMKIEAVTRRILWIKSSDPEAKVLVFSSWNDVLDVLEHAFNANGITYTRMKGGR